MNRLEQLETFVKELYDAMDPKREDWAEWLYKNHVFWVADKAQAIATNHHIDSELSRAAALLHDVADAEMSRFDPRHEIRSLELAQELLAQSGFSTEEISIVVDDAIRFHSCSAGEKPSSDIGLVLASADAAAHFLTDFMLHAFIDVSIEEYEERKNWARQKIEKDFHKKIFFPEVKAEVAPHYEALKQMLNS